MDFLDLKKKRAHKIRLFVGYFLMAIALGIGSFILLMEAYGYDVNRQTGGIIQNGMVFVGAHPAQAQIYVNGKHEGTTNTRLVLPEGDYDLSLERQGYTAWQRNFKLRGSSIERMDYAFLVPEQLTSTDSTLYGKLPDLATQSPDRKWLVVQKPGSLTDFEVIDLSNTNNPSRAFSLPTNFLTSSSQKNQQLEFVEWSNNNRHLVLKHNFGSQSEYVLVDIEKPNESYNLSKIFDLSIGKILLKDKKFDKYYILEAGSGDLISAELKDLAKQTILTNVQEFNSYGEDVLLYVTTKPAEGQLPEQVELRARQSKDDYKIRNLNKSNNYLLDVARYDDSWYMAAAEDSGKVGYIYKDVFDDIKRRGGALLPAPVAVLRLKNAPTNLEFSANTQFVGIQSGKEFSVYDAEHDRQYRYELDINVSSSTVARWMDGHRYTVVADGQAYMFDYDGLNRRQLTSAGSNFVFFDRDYNNLYTIGNSVSVQGRSSLARTPMRTPEDL